MRSVDSIQPAADSAPAKKLEPFSMNPQKANVWFSVMNGANFIFGGFFLAGASLWGMRALQALEAGSRALRSDFLQSFYAFVLAIFSTVFPDPVTAVTIILGWIPMAFAAVFYLVPLLRYRVLRRRNEKVKKENARRIVYGQAWASPENVLPDSATIPSKAFSSDAKTQAKLLDELAAYSEANIEAAPGGAYRYSFPELSRIKRSMAAIRLAADKDGFSVGKAIFDTESKPGSDTDKP